ncbi:hypothetical protein WJX82_004996 [Trebouxia sp. C0006]
MQSASSSRAAASISTSGQGNDTSRRPAAPDLLCVLLAYMANALFVCGLEVLLSVKRDKVQSIRVLLHLDPQLGHSRALRNNKAIIYNLCLPLNKSVLDVVPQIPIAYRQGCKSGSQQLKPLRSSVKDSISVNRAITSQNSGHGKLVRAYCCALYLLDFFFFLLQIPAAVLELPSPLVQVMQFPSPEPCQESGAS